MRYLIFQLLTFGMMVFNAVSAEIVATFDDWQVVQQGQLKSCFMLTEVVSAQSKVPLVAVQLQIRKDQLDSDFPATIGARVPLGASLKSGVAYRHTRQTTAVGLSWQYCDQSICLATGGVSQDELARLKRSRKIEVGYQPLPNSRTISVPVSLLGFTKAWEHLLTCHAR